MLEVKKRNWDFGEIVEIIDDKQSLNILFGGNGDLYFHPKSFSDYEKPINFVIKPSDGFIFERFNHLYNKICNYEPFDYIDDSLSENDYYKSVINSEKEIDSYRDYPLVNNGVISWHSDDAPLENSSILNISRLKNSYINLEFIKSKNIDNLYKTYAVRVSNSGSNYSPFNCCFVDLYNELRNYDFYMDQITIDQYLASIEEPKVLKKIK